MADAVRGSDRSLKPEARLELAGSLEARQQYDDALLAYYRAIIEAQRQSRWLDTASTPPALLDRVTRAMRFVKAGRRRAFVSVLEPIYARYGREAFHRFDDTYEHEAWNRGLQTRVVLIIDVWNPHLTVAERNAVAALVEAMGDFNRAAGI